MMSCDSSIKLDVNSIIYRASRFASATSMLSSLLKHVDRDTRVVAARLAADREYRDVGAGMSKQEGCRVIRTVPTDMIFYDSL